MKEIEFLPGSDIDSAWQELLRESADCKDTCCGMFNGKEIRSTDTLDEVYVKVLGITKADFDDLVRREREEYDHRKKEHKDKIPNLTKEYREKARGIILEDQYEYWDKIVPIRLDDLYHGMELDCTLDLCKIMRDESISYDKRLRKAYKTFIDQGHSGMSASLVSSMLRVFCPNGDELADAVMSFKFEKEENK